MVESPDAQLPLKKRARRRLLGAVAFAGLAAVVLPMVMDEEPKQQIQDVQIRIPGQDQLPSLGKPAMSKPAVLAAGIPAAEKPATPAKTEVQQPVAPPPAKVPEMVAPKPPEKIAEKPVEKKSEKPAEKVGEKPAEKAKPPEKPVKTAGDAQRAAAILSGKAPEAVSSTNGQYVILIGAFASPANVKQLQSKIGELGVKTFTEPLDSPQGKKTRVRAGPFPTRDAADKALDKMKRIGVSGVVTAKQ